jgi:hypothetical protein
LAVIAFATPWVYVIRAGTFFGSLSEASERWMILGVVVVTFISW